MDYKNKYEQALKKARIWKDKSGMPKDKQDILDDIFPELKESEDERIRTAIIHFISHTPTVPKGIIGKETMLAWLEKQGKQKSLTIDIKSMVSSYEQRLKSQVDIENSPLVNMCLTAFRRGVENTLDELYLKQIFANSTKTCKDEQKPTDKVEPKFHIGDKIRVFRKGTTNEEPMTITKIDEKGYWSDDLFICNFIDADRRLKLAEQNLVDKVEPRFKVGEWVTDGDIHCKISDILDDRYIVDTKFAKRSCIPFKRENNYHLWTIQDAKDGDVLCYKDEVFLYKHNIKNCTLKETSFGGMVYYCCYNGKRFITNSMYSLTEKDKDDIHPATKEQRDTLIKAMADAGYTFDFDKKELNKIEQKPTDETPYPETLEKAIDLYYYSYGNGKGEFEHLSLEKFRDIVHTFVSDYEQKPAWGEEDEQITLSIEQVMNCASLLNIVPEKTDKIRTWLKSLKQRIGG